MPNALCSPLFLALIPSLALADDTGGGPSPLANPRGVEESVRALISS